jgi:hypothetical protein
MLRLCCVVIGWPVWYNPKNDDHNSIQVMELIRKNEGKIISYVLLLQVYIPILNDFSKTLDFPIFYVRILLDRKT